MGWGGIGIEVVMVGEEVIEGEEVGYRGEGIG